MSSDHFFCYWCDSGSNCCAPMEVGTLEVWGVLFSLWVEGQLSEGRTVLASGRTCLLGCLGAALSFKGSLPPRSGCLSPSLPLLQCLPRECISFLCPLSWLHNSEHDGGCWLYHPQSPEVWNLPGLTFCPGISYGQGSSEQQLQGVSLHGHIGASRSRLPRTHPGLER